MSITSLFAIAVLVIVGGIILFRVPAMIRTYFTYHGKRLIICPENHERAAIDVAARKAAAWEFLGTDKLRLDTCSRWPEMRHCGQECLEQVEADPENCLVWNIVSNWYEGKSCMICHKPFSRLQHLDHTPALMGLDHKTMEWSEVRPEQLPEVLSTHKPVCWNCHISETFRRIHPELVVDRHRQAG